MGFDYASLVAEPPSAPPSASPAAAAKQDGYLDLLVPCYDYIRRVDAPPSAAGLASLAERDRDTAPTTTTTTTTTGGPGQEEDEDNCWRWARYWEEERSDRFEGMAGRYRHPVAGVRLPHIRDYVSGREGGT